MLKIPLINILIQGEFLRRKDIYKFLRYSKLHLQILVKIYSPQENCHFKQNIFLKTIDPDSYKDQVSTGPTED